MSLLDRFRKQKRKKENVIPEKSAETVQTEEKKKVPAEKAKRAPDVKLPRKKVSDEKRDEIRQKLQRFKMDMMKKYPFYGDILMHIPVIEDDRIPTAQTNGREIRYSPVFFATLTEGQRNYVLLHEVMHILLLHWKRTGNRKPLLWNIACDFMVNGIIDQLRWYMRQDKIPFDRPVNGCYTDSWRYPSAEEAYARLLEENRDLKQIRYLGNVVKARPGDLTEGGDPAEGGELSGALTEETEKQIREMIRETVKRRGERSAGRYASIPAEILKLGIVPTKRLPWHKLLYEFLQDRQEEESSYMTPERKYLHMDLIVPGCGRTEDELGEIWAFVDTSGSIRTEELEQFLTQLCRISAEFRCKFHIGFWDTRVSEVYRNVRGTKQILECVPHSTGGTDINCIYEYLRTNRIKPEVMLILTDGYFGEVAENIGSLPKKTILVISEDGRAMERNNGIGKLARL